MIFKTPDILLPKNEYDYTKWSVVACDQFTSQKAYWDKLDKTVGDISTLRIIFPEVFLGQNEADRIKNINTKMQEYLDKNIFKEIKNSYILVDRKTNYGRQRLGLMIAVDLEEYDFKPGSNASIKATEATVIERIPVRVKIRENALLEVPHIMLLMDDNKKEIIEGLYAKKDNFEKLYDFDLNMNGGHLTGYKIDNVDDINAQLSKLNSPEVLKEKYGSDKPFLFAVGDGNHSLATAKACWDKIKDSVEDKENHPARYALVELVNLYDNDLIFEPIHRAVFNCSTEFVNGLKEVAKGEIEAYIVCDGVKETIKIGDSSPDAIAKIQKYIDSYCETHSESEVDYIHGEDNTLEVAKENNGVAILMPTICKNELFKYVVNCGVLCRKSFSMGEAEEKRYYVESKRIKD